MSAREVWSTGRQPTMTGGVLQLHRTDMDIPEEFEALRRAQQTPPIGFRCISWSGEVVE